MTVKTLYDALAAYPQSRPCLYSAAGLYSLGDVLRQASAGWSSSATDSTFNSRIALRSLGPLQLIEAVIAFDGRVDAILLLPNSLDESTCQELTRTARCTHLIEAGQRILASLEASDLPERQKPEATRWILATSGTTGKPKLIEHTLESLSRTVRRDLNKGGELVWGLLYDPNRFAGLQVVLQALLGGSSLALPDSDVFEDQVRALFHSPVNALSATPSMWRKLLMDGRVCQLALRQITLGGEIADQSILDALKKCFPDARITHIYASTEAGTGFAVNDGKAGFPVAWLEEATGPVPIRINEHGHLLLKPPVLASGAEIQSRLDQSGFLDTQDIVKVSGDRVVFLGRVSGAINVGGNKVVPEEVEQVIRSVVGIQEVKVYPRRNSVVGQLVAADVVLQDGFDATSVREKINQICRAQLEAWQVPAFIRFVSTININPAGKVERTQA
ncbi:MAG TPA: fatty acid--CoA ligase family protein [Pirellulaceae bacterium]|nr:fatty acid--CoA ligase family protein [Pirellulaceae bacterium]HMP70882.1 fatty acid--CoA ligase family protein [Pirellulaceae bacterium]